MSVIKINSSIRNYQVEFGSIKVFLEDSMETQANVYVIDENVWKYYSRNILNSLEKQSQRLIILSISEDKKNIESVQLLYDQLLELSAKRNLNLISIGGGILQDITGFLASTLYRGINWIYLPTTTLSQADSCIGGKTSLNYKNFKNIIGTFYPPNRIIIDTSLLKTLEDSIYLSGIGEMIKLHILGGLTKVQKMINYLPDLLTNNAVILNTVIYESLLIKLQYIEADEFDLGKRAYLNYGHCFGHAIESITKFGIPHGQAVLIGMLLANKVSLIRGLITIDFEKFITKELLLPGLNVKDFMYKIDKNNLIAAMKNDKKRKSDGLALILLKENYEIIQINDLTPDEVNSAIQHLQSC